MPFRISFIFLLAGLLFPACRKITTVNLPSGTISILSTKVTGLTSYELKVGITLAEGQVIANSSLVFEDITVSSDSSFEWPVTLSPGNTIITVEFKKNRLNHDYAVTAYMQTNMGKCISEKVVIRSEKNTFRIYLHGDPEYQDPENQIGLFFHRKYNLVFYVDYLTMFYPDSVAEKLNGTIPIDCQIHFSDPEGAGGHLTALGVSTLPSDLPAGIYAIHVYLDGLEFISENKFKIPEGSWIKYDTTYPGDKTIDRSWFLLGSDLFLVGGHSIVSNMSEVAVWKFNMETKLWQRRNNFSGSSDITGDEILPFNLQYNDEGYIVYGHDTTFRIWKYQPGNDSWTFVTVFPGPRLYRMISFVTGDHLYLGGGQGHDNVYRYAFWSFDLVNGTWTKLNDLPVTAITLYNVACVTGNKAYVFEFSRNLWEYDPGTDSWNKKSVFPGPRRIVTNLVASGADLYVIGGEYFQYPYYQLDDCWKYSLTSGQWELQSFLPDQYNYGLSFTYGNQVFTGFGYTTELPYYVMQPELLQFVP